jgi:hypothetical protein
MARSFHLKRLWNHRFIGIEHQRAPQEDQAVVESAGPESAAAINVTVSHQPFQQDQSSADAGDFFPSTRETSLINN